MDLIAISVEGTTEQIQIIVEDNIENISVSVSEVVGSSGTSTMVTLYTGIGNEGMEVILPAIISKDILMLFKGDKRLKPTSGTPTVNQYKYTSSTGRLQFGNDIEFDQEIEILWKNI